MTMCSCVGGPNCCRYQNEADNLPADFFRTRGYSPQRLMPRESFPEFQHRIRQAFGDPVRDTPPRNENK